MAAKYRGSWLGSGVAGTGHKSRENQLLQLAPDVVQCADQGKARGALQLLLDAPRAGKDALHHCSHAEDGVDEFGADLLVQRIERRLVPGSSAGISLSARPARSRR